jgi:hypothetical protein
MLLARVSVAQDHQNASGSLYRFTMDYFTFGADDAFRSKERVVGDYRERPDGTVEWTNVTIAAAHTMDESFAPGEPQTYMDGFRYRPGRDESTKPGFFKNFPENATSTENLVWDTQMFESFAKEFGEVTALPHRLPPSDVSLAGMGTFHNKNIELMRTGTAERILQQLRPRPGRRIENVRAKRLLGRHLGVAGDKGR